MDGAAPHDPRHQYAGDRQVEGNHPHSVVEALEPPEPLVRGQEDVVGVESNKVDDFTHCSSAEIAAKVQEVTDFR